MRIFVLLILADLLRRVATVLPPLLPIHIVCHQSSRRVTNTCNISSNMPWQQMPWQQQQPWHSNIMEEEHRGELQSQLEIAAVVLLPCSQCKEVLWVLYLLMVFLLMNICSRCSNTRQQPHRCIRCNNNKLEVVEVDPFPICMYMGYRHMVTHIPMHSIRWALMD